MVIRVIAPLAVCAALAACEKPPKPVRERAPAEPRVEHTLQLPHGDGRVHIVAIRDRSMFEVTRCLIAVGPNGQAAVSCAPKELDLAPPDE
jgi:hypothetical protein